MTIGEFLAVSTRKLRAADILTARLDVLILLCDALQCDKAYLLAHADQELSGGQLRGLEANVATRSQHTPLAYIRGHVMFYGRDFIVSPDVLVPRPETETIIDLVRQQHLPDRPKIADIGTGSGCIGITLALELPQATVDLYDISAEALKIAQKNNIQLNAGVQTFTSDLLMKLQGFYDVIAANLPYVPDAYPINEAAKQEPALALFSGADGLSHYRSFWKQIDGLESKPSTIITESLPSQHHTLASIARIHGYILEKTDDFIQLFIRA